MSAVSSLLFARSGGRVTRFHCFPNIMPDYVGHHTFNLLCMLMVCLPPEKLTKQLLLAALVHDIPERVTGDIPSPTKDRGVFDRQALAALEESVMEHYGLPWPPQDNVYLRMADCLDGMFHCLEEARMGNATMLEPFTQYGLYVEDLFQAHDYSETHFQEVYNFLMEQREKVKYDY